MCLPGDAKNVFDPPVSNHSRARASSSELHDLAESFAKRRRTETKSPPNVVDHPTSSSCLPTAHGNDAPLTQTKHCLFIALMMKLSVCPWSGHTSMIVFQLMNAKRSELEDVFGNLVFTQVLSQRYAKLEWLLKWTKQATGQIAPEPDWYCDRLPRWSHRHHLFRDFSPW